MAPIPISVSSGDTSHFDVLSHLMILDVTLYLRGGKFELAGVGYGVLTPLESI